MASALLVFGPRGFSLPEILAENGIKLEFLAGFTSKETTLLRKSEDLGQVLIVIYERPKNSTERNIR